MKAYRLFSNAVHSKPSFLSLPYKQSEKEYSEYLSSSLLKGYSGYGATVYGFLSAIQAIGSLFGGILIGNLGHRYQPARLLGVCLLIFGFIDLVIIDIPFFIPGLFIIALLFALVGIPGTGIVVGANSLLQTLVEDKLRGRVFGAFLAIDGLASLVGMGLASLFGDRLGVTFMLNTQGIVYILAGILILWALWNSNKLQIHRATLTHKGQKYTQYY